MPEPVRAAAAAGGRALPGPAGGAPGGHGRAASRTRPIRPHGGHVHGAGQGFPGRARRRGGAAGFQPLLRHGAGAPPAGHHLPHPRLRRPALPSFAARRPHPRLPPAEREARGRLLPPQQRDGLPGPVAPEARPALGLGRDDGRGQVPGVPGGGGSGPPRAGAVPRVPGGADAGQRERDSEVCQQRGEGVREEDQRGAARLAGLRGAGAERVSESQHDPGGGFCGGGRRRCARHCPAEQVTWGSFSETGRGGALMGFSERIDQIPS